MKSCSPFLRALLVVCIAALLAGSACKGGPLESKEIAYVSAPEVNLRDRVAAIYNRVGVAKNGDRVEVLDRQKRFVKVRTSGGLEGWVEQRYLVDEEVFNQFKKLEDDNKGVAHQGHGKTRATLNMHVTPARDSAKLYQLSEAEDVEILKRATAERPSKQPVAIAKPAEGKPADPEPKAYDDWWLVRNAQGRVGWALARMIDLDVPMEVAQYSEGQRIVGAYVINKLPDEGKEVAQYLVLFSENRDGLPYDYNQARVFTWNAKRDRYETAYRERGLMGFLPVTIGSENFGNEGTLPTFTLRVQMQDGSIGERKYKLNQPIVRRVTAPGESQMKAATPPKAEKPKAAKRRK